MSYIIVKGLIPQEKYLLLYVHRRDPAPIIGAPKYIKQTLMKLMRKIDSNTVK
jgi:hypothetical protein